MQSLRYVYFYLSIERKQILIRPVSVGTMDGLFILQQRPHYMNLFMRKDLALANSKNTFQVALCTLLLIGFENFINICSFAF